MRKRQFKRYTRSTAGNILAFALLTLMGIFTILPLIYSISTSLKPLDELLTFPPKFFVSRPTTMNYRELPEIIASLSVPLSRYVFNSIFVSVITTVLHIFVATMTAFVLSKGKFRGLKALFWLVQLSLLFNSYTLAIPQYIIFSKIKIVDTFLVYIIPYIPSTLGIFLCKQYMDSSIPDALIEAAHIDGAGDFIIYLKIILPIVKPAWLTLTLYSFRDLWSLQPQGTIFSEELKMLPNVLSTITNGGIARSGSAMAATVLMMIPPTIVYLISQSSVTETMSTSGIK